MVYYAVEISQGHISYKRNLDDHLTPYIMSSSELLNPIHPGMLPRLDPRFVEYYNQTLANRLGTHQVPLEDVRANPGSFARKWALDPSAAPDPCIRDWDVTVADGSTSIKIRAYHPNESRWGTGPYPVHINFHGLTSFAPSWDVIALTLLLPGGGWVFGDLGSDAAICLRLRDRLPIVVVDVDYRLCPGMLMNLVA